MNLKACSFLCYVPSGKNHLLIKETNLVLAEVRPLVAVCSKFTGYREMNQDITSLNFVNQK
jgi:hypothetical protein